MSEWVPVYRDGHGFAASSRIPYEQLLFEAARFGRQAEREGREIHDCTYQPAEYNAVRQEWESVVQFRCTPKPPPQPRL